jgi:hypothetical protein
VLLEYVPSVGDVILVLLNPVRVDGGGGEKIELIGFGAKLVLPVLVLLVVVVVLD